MFTLKFWVIGKFDLPIKLHFSPDSWVAALKFASRYEAMAIAKVLYLVGCIERLFSSSNLKLGLTIMNPVFIRVSMNLIVLQQPSKDSTRLWWLFPFRFMNVTLLPSVLGLWFKQTIVDYGILIAMECHLQMTLLVLQLVHCLISIEVLRDFYNTFMFSSAFGAHGLSIEVSNTSCYWVKV
jgi:hypothetical protein